MRLSATFSEHAVVEVEEGTGIFVKVVWQVSVVSIASVSEFTESSEMIFAVISWWNISPEYWVSTFCLVGPVLVLHHFCVSVISWQWVHLLRSVEVLNVCLSLRSG